MKLYISGPMTGLRNYNERSFEDAAHTLRAKGHTVVNPTELPEPVVPPDATEAISWSAYLVRDIAVLNREKPDYIILLPGWRTSRGASLEAHYAKEILGIPAKALGEFLAEAYAFPWPSKKEESNEHTETNP